MSPAKPSAGDLTGNTKAQQQHDALQDQRDRRAEMSHASAVEEREMQTGVFDPHNQERIDVPKVSVVEETTLPGDGFYKEARREEPVFTGYESDEQMTPFLAQRHEPVIPQAILREPMVKIRVTQDIEDMTYGFTSQGYPNNMTFREGFVYEVDINIADHLNQRNLVAQWVS